MKVEMRGMGAGTVPEGKMNTRERSGKVANFDMSPPVYRNDRHSMGPFVFTDMYAPDIQSDSIAEKTTHDFGYATVDHTDRGQSPPYFDMQNNENSAKDSGMVRVSAHMRKKAGPRNNSY